MLRLYWLVLAEERPFSPGVKKNSTGYTNSGIGLKVLPHSTLKSIRLVPGNFVAIGALAVLGMKFTSPAAARPRRPARRRASGGGRRFHAAGIWRGWRSRCT